MADTVQQIKDALADLSNRLSAVEAMQRVGDTSTYQFASLEKQVSGLKADLLKVTAQCAELLSLYKAQQVTIAKKLDASHLSSREFAGNLVKAMKPLADEIKSIRNGMFRQAEQMDLTLKNERLAIDLQIKQLQSANRGQLQGSIAAVELFFAALR